MTDHDRVPQFFVSDAVNEYKSLTSRKELRGNAGPRALCLGSLVRA